MNRYRQPTKIVCESRFSFCLISFSFYSCILTVTVNLCNVFCFCFLLILHFVVVLMVLVPSFCTSLRCKNMSILVLSYLFAGKSSSFLFFSCIVYLSLLSVMWWACVSAIASSCWNNGAKNK